VRSGRVGPRAADVAFLTLSEFPYFKPPGPSGQTMSRVARHGKRVQKWSPFNGGAWHPQLEFGTCRRKRSAADVTENDDSTREPMAGPLGPAGGWASPWAVRPSTWVTLTPSPPNFPEVLAIGHGDGDGHGIGNEKPH